MRRYRGPGASTREAPDPVPGEVYLEYFSVGKQMRVVAVDAASGIEVTVFGPASVSREDLARLAIRKLARRLERDKPPASLRLV